MLRIYNAYANKEDIVIENYIKFNEMGRFDTGLNGFGQIHSGNLSVRRVSLERSTLDSFKNQVKDAKVIDGYLDNFILYTPTNEELLHEKFKDLIKTSEDYEKYRLTEEAVLLFVDYLEVKPIDDITRLFGRYYNNGLYLIEPNNRFTLSNGSKEEIYEVLQSNSLTKELTLSKVKRLI